MFFETSQDVFKGLIAKSADLANKPFIHSVVNTNGRFTLEEDDLDLTLNILCRDFDGKRLERYDLELEIFRSNNDLVLVLSKLNYPNEPILWSGTKTLWMDSCTGKKCSPPIYSSQLENLANRIKTSFEFK